MADGVTGAAALGWDERSEDWKLPKKAATEIGERVARARRHAGISGNELGAAVGLRKDQISKIESGRRRLDVGELPKVAAALGVTVRYLLGQPERPTLAVAARLVADAAPEASRAMRRRARQLVELDDLLARVADMPAARPSAAGASVIEQVRTCFATVPRTKRAAQAQGKQLAELARRALDLGSDALGDLATLMEQHFAVDVALSPIGTEVDGLCVHSGDLALILASSDFSDGHLRFTLAHELGHHLLGDPRIVIEEAERDMFGDNSSEWRVNAFAAHLLMPERGIRSVLDWLGEMPGRVSERAVVALMEHFGVSMAALIYQLNTIGALSYEAGRQIRDRNSVRTIVSRHRDVAPTGAACATRHIRRAPERLNRYALAAVRSQRLGLSVVSALLEVEDEEQLWDDLMDDTKPADPSPEITL